MSPLFSLPRCIRLRCAAAYLGAGNNGGGRDGEHGVMGGRGDLESGCPCSSLRSRAKREGARIRTDSRDEAEAPAKRCAQALRSIAETVPSAAADMLQRLKQLSPAFSQVRFASTGGWVKPQTLDLPSVSADARRRTVTVLPGDGVGPEVIAAAQECIAATGEKGEFGQETGDAASLRRRSALRAAHERSPRLYTASHARERGRRDASNPQRTSARPPPGAPIEWETFKLSGLPGSPGYVNTVPKEVIDSIARNKVCLKGLQPILGPSRSSLCCPDGSQLKYHSVAPTTLPLGSRRRP